MLKLLLLPLVLFAAVERGPDVSVSVPDATGEAAPAAESAPAPPEAETEPASVSMKRMLSGAGVNPFKAVGSRLDGHWDFLASPRTVTDVLSQVHIVWAAIFVVIGALCVTNGYRWHRGLMVLLAGILGLYVGTMVGERIGSTNVVAACAAVLFAVVAWPMLRYTVALFGGLAGAFAGANIWTCLEFPQQHHQYGAIIGLVAVGMLAFMAFRGVVILLTSVGGSSMLVLGAMAALMHIDAWRGGMADAANANRLIIPIITASVAVVGVIYQLGGGVTGLNAMAAKADPKAAAVKKAA